MRHVAPAVPLNDLSEREWQTQVVALAKLMGWKRIYHTYNSQRSHSGFPDLVMARERLIFVELKSMAGKLSPSQQEWLDALTAAGAETHVWRPSDLEQVAEVLRRRQPTIKEAA